ncbi:MAG TPA: selenocysteine-specific translation elongation factor [Egibacteraceae bacterium]|nr:selenocysteine-specific translation elongation factor [Egibacteraceae bacterium]
MRVICTAGHVDHGKSTLVKALTGMEPDRFAEERRRGLTIDLGFAWTRLDQPGAPHAETIAFVDLPGHERFIANMLAGAGPIELALLVIAADEGWMPQTQEHLDILELLGVSRAVVAITKADLVTSEEQRQAADLARHQLAASPLAAAQIVIVSARRGQGLDSLRRALADMVRSAPPPADLARPRLWVDRVFTITGAGTVVTGTLRDGSIRAGDQLVVLPSGIPARVRGLQSLNEPVSEVAPGARVAINLAGVPRESVGRGDALGMAGEWLAVAEFDAWIRALPGGEIAGKGDWHLHIGSAERTARVLPLSGAAIGGGRDSARDAQQFARIRLDRPLPATAGDAFVLREAGRRATLGGGLVVDADPPQSPRGSAARTLRVRQLTARRAALDAGDRGELLALHVQERGAAEVARARAALGLGPEQAAAAAQRHGLQSLGGFYATAAQAERWSAAALDAVRLGHVDRPLDPTVPRDVAIRAAVGAGCPASAAPGVIEVLLAAGRLAADGPGLRIPEHRSRLDPSQSAARDALLAALRREPFRPPPLGVTARAAGASEALIRALAADGTLARLGPDLAFTAEALDAAVTVLLDAFRQEGPLTAGRAKELLGTSRKYALPLLEELDRQGRTRRTGDTREVLG